MKADLHIHTKYSDGAYTVQEILSFTKDLDYIAITDHDTFSGAKEAYNLNNTKTIVGIELSTDYYGESVHILGYFRNLEDIEALEVLLVNQQQNRINRAKLISQKLKDIFNIEIAFDDISKPESITRGTIADAIISKGYPYSRIEIFSKMLGDGQPAYIPSTKLSTKAGIEVIKVNNGVAFLAHPILLKRTNILDIIKLGIDGIEAIYPLHNKRMEKQYRVLAKEHQLLISGGSDFHDCNDGLHGNIGSSYLSNNDLDKFLLRMGKD